MYNYVIEEHSDKIEDDSEEEHEEMIMRKRL